MTATTKDRRWIAVAKKMLLYSNHPKYKMVAILVKGGKIVSMGTNSLGPPAFFIRYAENRGRHAEVRCLFGLDKKYTKGATLYVVGLTAVGNIILSRPCKGCEDFIKRMGLRRVVYHTVTDEIVGEKI